DIPKNGPVEFHLFVNEKCPHRPNELLELLSERSSTGFIMEEWFVGVHIVNLHRITQINEFMEAAAEPLKVSAKALRRVSRGKKRRSSITVFRVVCSLFQQELIQYIQAYGMFL